MCSQEKKKISGKKEDITKVFAKIKGVEKDGSKIAFDFNSLIPMPKSLDIINGSKSTDALAYYKAKQSGDRPTLTRIEDKYKNDEHNENKVFRSDLFKLGRQLQSNIDLYGCQTWYDWCRIHWGTKWNAYNIKILDKFMSFQTAWNFPDEVFKRLATYIIENKLNVSFTATYASEDIGSVCGEFEFNDDGDIFHACHDWCSPEAYNAARFVWGE